MMKNGQDRKTKERGRGRGGKKRNKKKMNFEPIHMEQLPFTSAIVVDSNNNLPPPPPGVEPPFFQQQQQQNHQLHSSASSDFPDVSLEEANNALKEFTILEGTISEQKKEISSKIAAKKQLCNFIKNIFKKRNKRYIQTPKGIVLAKRTQSTGKITEYMEVQYWDSVVQRIQQENKLPTGKQLRADYRAWEHNKKRELTSYRVTIEVVKKVPDETPPTWHDTNFSLDDCDNDD